MVIGAFMLGFVGLALIVIGYLVWKKEKISLLHDYHYEKVAEENKKAFCTLSGVGLLVMGVGLEVAAVVLGVTDSLWSFLAVGVGSVVGFPLLLSAEKYNR